MVGVTRLRRRFGYALARVQSEVLGRRFVRRVDSTDAEFAVGTFPEYKHLLNNRTEDPVLSDLLSNLRAEDTFYDVGAHLGVYACLAASVCDVVAVEADERVFERLRRNMELNGAGDRAYRYALSDEPGSVELAVNQNWGSRPVTADAISGDELIDRHDLPAPTVMKIDVEGYEVKVLRGLERAIASGDLRLLYVEVHPGEIADGTGEDLHALLSGAGFEVDRIHDRGGNHFLKCER